MSLTEKKVYCIFEEPLHLNIIVDELFSLVLRIPGEKKVKLKKIGI